MTTDATDAAVRIAAGDDRTRYDPVAMALHWATALIVVWQFLSSQTWGYFARSTRHTMITGHMSFGMILAAIIVARIIWRLMPGHQVPAVVTGPVELASKAVHYLLYTLLAASAVLGFALRWSGAEDMSFFGLLIPPPFGPVSKPVHQTIGTAHEYVGWAIVILAAGHAIAALVHYYVLRDRVLGRMWPWVRRAG